MGQKDTYTGAFHIVFFPSAVRIHHSTRGTISAALLTLVVLPVMYRVVLPRIERIFEPRET